jgi:hypothetical protein
MCLSGTLVSTVTNRALRQGLQYSFPLSAIAVAVPACLVLDSRSRADGKARTGLSAQLRFRSVQSVS